MNARRLVLAGLVSLCAVACGSLLASAQAFAASAPVLGEESALNVSGESATLQAEVNPEGSATTYRFEYGTSEAYGQSAATPEGVAGTGAGSVTVEAHVQGLQSDTTYHFRVVASSEGGTERGVDETFTTQTVVGGGALTLPDSRQWELVTPPHKEGALFYGQNFGHLFGTAADPFVTKAAVGGDAIIDLASQPTEGEPQGGRNEVSVLSTRGPAGWSSQVIAPPHDRGAGVSFGGEGGEYRLFSEDLSLGVVQQFGPFTPLSAGASEPTPYLRSDYLNGSVNEHCQTSCFEPLVTRADTREGVAFGEEVGGQCIYVICGPEFLDATPDLSHVILKGRRGDLQLTSTQNQAEQYGGTYYEWSDGQLQPLYLLPKSEGETGVFAGTGPREPLGERALIDHQLADNGSVFFSYGGHVYLHDFARGESMRLDVAQGVGEPSGGGAEFLYASADGSKVFFTDSTQLTKALGGGIYECRIVESANGVACELELTGLSGGSLVGGSKDASYLYFMGTGEKLIVDRYDGRGWTTTEGPVIPQTETSGFLYDKDFKEEGGNPPNYRISPDGRFVAFMSDQNLTHYNNHDAVSGQPDEEVYLYDASSNRLVCASCAPTGARPVGAEASESTLGSGDFPGGGIWVAASVPPWTHSGNGSGYLYQPRYLSDSGRLFFDSYDALVPQDVDGTLDVYQYEPAGVGGCGLSSVTYNVRSGGCVGLVSSGSSPEESAFMDASGTGGDVFFITLAKLVPQDFDGALDVYDAHECTAVAPCYPSAPVSAPACSTGDSCKPSPSPQPTIFGPTPSATFSGAGNVIPSGSPPVVNQRSLTRAQKLAQALRSCRKKDHKRRAACEREAHKRYGPVGKPGRASVEHRGRR